MFNHPWSAGRSWILAALIAGMGLMPSMARAEPSVVLADHFDNGVPADTDIIASFWKIDLGAGGGMNKIVENQNSSGLLEVALAGGTGQSMPKLLMRSDVSNDFNFATGQITLSIKAPPTASGKSSPANWTAAACA